MDLYIAEKPSLGRKIADHLGKGDPKQIKKHKSHISGNGWVVTWCFGHLYELAPPGDYRPEWGKAWSLDHLPIIPTELIYKPKESTVNQIKVIKDLASKAERIFHAGDPDREGQLLVDDAINRSGFKGPVFRLWPDDLSPTGLEKAFKKIRPNSEFLPLSQSAASRRSADWIVGMNFTRFYTCLGSKQGHQGVVSLGRVQTVVFSLVHDRCIEIENFKPVHHYGAAANFSAQNGIYKGTLVLPESLLDENGHALDKGKIQQIVDSVAGGQAVVKSVTKELKKEKAAITFSLTKLQVHASKKWGYSAKEVVSACQYLYEDLNALSYPRTECGYLSEGDFSEANAVINTIKKTIDISRIENDINTSKMPRCYDDSKTEAHTGIIPTQSVPDYSRFEALSGREKSSKNIASVDVLKNIYSAASEQFLKQFLPDHEYESTKIITEAQGYNFNTTGRVEVKRGWKVLESDSKDKKSEETLPEVGNGESVSVHSVEIESKKTKPQEYFNDGTLIAAMANIANFITDPEAKKRLKETDGIGTTATRADIIEKIKNANYVYLDKKSYKVTQLGRDLYKAFPPYFKTASMTAIWESALERIAEGKLDHNKFNANIIGWTQTNIQQLIDNPPEINLTLNSKYKCPKCDKPLLPKKGQFGPYWACADRECKTSFPDFKKAPLFPMDGDGESCPECKKGKMKTRATKPQQGKPSQSFLGCDNFPDCRHAEWPKE